MARVVALFEDLMLGSNAQGWLQAGGHEVTLSSKPDNARAALAEADVFVVDLAAERFDGIEVVEATELAGKPTLGVYRHTDDDTRVRAKEAGFDLVVPRSRFAREGAQLVDGLVD